MVTSFSSTASKRPPLLESCELTNLGSIPSRWGTCSTQCITFIFYGLLASQVSPSSEATDSVFTFVCAGGEGVVRLWNVTLKESMKGVTTCTCRCGCEGLSKNPTRHSKHVVVSIRPLLLQQKPTL